MRDPGMGSAFGMRLPTPDSRALHLAPGTWHLCPDFHHPMGYQSALAAEEDNVPGKRWRSGVAGYGQNVSRPHRRQHTRAVDSQTQLSERTERFRRQLTTHSLPAGG